MREFDLIIVGAGPAGYVAAIRAGQLGMSTALIERDKLGGMCLNWGCIPSKTLMESAKFYSGVLTAESFGIDGIDRESVTFNWKKATARKDRVVRRLVKGVEFLMKKNRVEIIIGEATLGDGGEVSVADDRYKADRIIVATGSRPGGERLGAVSRSRILQIAELFDSEEVDDSFVVYGSSAYACETAFMLRLIGKQVALVAPEDRIMPALDHDLSQFIMDKFAKMEIRLHLGCGAIKDSVNGVFAGDEAIECDKVINCSDRVAVLPEMEPELAIQGGFISIDEYMRTSVESIYAAGDVTGQITAHTGSAQGIAAVNHIAGIKEPIDYHKLPVNLYLSPEVASVGLSEAELEATGQEYSKGVFPLTANGKAMAEGVTEGFVKVLAEKKYGEVLGVHIVAPHATDMVAEAVAIMQLEGTLEDVGRIVHAHPTISESIIEASLVASGLPRHL